MAAGRCGASLPAGGGDAPVMSDGGGLTEGGDCGDGGSVTTGGGGSGSGDGDEDDIIQINQFSPFPWHHLKFHIPGDQIINFFLPNQTLNTKAKS